MVVVLPFLVAVVAVLTTQSTHSQGSPWTSSSWRDQTSFSWGISYNSLWRWREAMHLPYESCLIFMSNTCFSGFQERQAKNLRKHQTAGHKVTSLSPLLVPWWMIHGEFTASLVPSARTCRREATWGAPASKKICPAKSLPRHSDGSCDVKRMGFGIYKPEHSYLKFISSILIWSYPSPVCADETPCLQSHFAKPKKREFLVTLRADQRLLARWSLCLSKWIIGLWKNKIFTIFTVCAVFGHRSACMDSTIGWDDLQMRRMSLSSIEKRSWKREPLDDRCYQRSFGDGPC